MRDFIARTLDLDYRDADLIVAIAAVILADDRDPIVIQRVATRSRKGELFFNTRRFQLDRCTFRLGADKEPAAGVIVSEEIAGVVDKATTCWVCWTGAGPPPPPHWDPRTRQQRLRDLLRSR